MGAETGFDAIARELAAGQLSRRAALKRIAVLGLGAAIVPAQAAAALGGGCPGDRVKCDGKCCPKGAKCKRGRCKCTDGRKKCGNKCVDLDTSPKHCGACGVVCEEGQACVDGKCKATVVCGGTGQPCCAGNECTSASDCCSGGICTAEGTACSEPSTVCAGGACAPCGASGQQCCEGSACAADDHDCCGGVCTGITFDPNCGMCGWDCFQVCAPYSGYCNGSYCECQFF